MKNKLNLGCGREVLKDFINVDINNMDGVNLVWDLNEYSYPFPSNSIDYVLADNILEHLDDKIKPLEEIWRIAKHKSIVKIIVPICPSVFAFGDPTHKQFFTYKTFDYFKKESGLNYYSKARFDIKKIRIRFPPFFKVLNPIVNISRFTQKAYYLLFSFIIPAMFLEVELEVLK